MADFCEGFQFRYFKPDRKGRRRSVKQNAYFRTAEDRFLQKVLDLLKNRLDILTQLMCRDNGIEIHLYHGNGFVDYKEEYYLFGRATQDGEDIILELAVEEVLYGGQYEHEEVLDVVVHELVHAIDFLDGVDGVMPGWDVGQLVRFDKARRKEEAQIKKGQSPMSAYALVSEYEFLAVLAETFFYKPNELKKSNRTLYTMMKQFFKQDPAATREDLEKVG